MLRSSVPPSTLLPLLALIVLAAGSSQTSCHAQVSVVRTIAKTFRCRFTSIIGLIMQHPPVRSVISAVSPLEHAPRTRQRQVGAPALCIVQTLITCTSLVLSSVLPTWCTAPEPTSSYKIQISSRFFHVSVSVSFSYAYDLVVERLVPTYPFLYYYHSSYQYFSHLASCLFGPTRTPVDTLLDFVPSSFGFSSMVLALVPVLQFLFPLPFVYQHFACLAIAYKPFLTVGNCMLDRRTIQSLGSLVLILCVRESEL
jgi:hypothetical protein